MIAFVSLFLGLVVGPQPLELTVGDGIASAVVLLDAQEVARLEGPPWRTVVDLGEVLTPRKLEAVALDADGEEQARVVQWLNVPQPPARASVVIEPETDGRPPIARLAWESVAGSAPISLDVTFDGRPLVVTDPRHIELPRYDPAQLHFLRAELVFSENVSSVVEATLGGTYTDQVSTELTAIVLQVDRKVGRPTVEAMQGLLTHDGAPVRVVAVDQAPASVMLIPDRSAGAEMARIARGVPVYLGRSDPRTSGRLRFWARLDREADLRMIWPVHRSQEGATIPFQLFATSQYVDGAEIGLFSLLGRARRPSGLVDAEQRLVDAVAVAGMEAAGRRRPRAVILVLGRQPDDNSRLALAQVQRYLADIQVPLHVWSLHRKPQVPTGWDVEVLDASRAGAFEGAVQALDRALGRQWIAWIDGTYLPQTIELDPSLEGIRLAR